MGKKHLRLVIPIVTGILVYAGLGYSASTGKSQVPTEAAPSKKTTSVKKQNTIKSSKVATILNMIDTAKSLDEIRTAFNNARLSDAEKRQLDQEIKKPDYSKKLKNLSKGPQSAARSRLKTNGRKTPDRQKKLEQEQDLEIQRLNQQARATYSRIKAQGLSRKGRASRVEVRSTEISGTMMAFSSGPAAASGPGGHDWRIDNVDPRPAVVGQEITITGSGFGRRGQVEIVLRDIRIRRPADSIASWSDNRIVARLPEDLASYAGETGRTAHVWVKPADGGGIGPTREIDLQPDTSTMRPEITVLSSETISPGQEITMAGRNFLTERPGRVEFIFGAYRFLGEVAGDAWEDTVIRSRLARNISGLIGMDGVVEVENHLGLRTSRAITFKPRLELQIFQEESHHLCWGFLGNRERKTYFRDRSPLRNQWTVDWSGLWTGGWGDHGCEIVEQPEKGSTDPEFTFYRRCGPVSGVTCRATVSVTGPLGTRY